MHLLRRERERKKGNEGRKGGRKGGREGGREGGRKEGNVWERIQYGVVLFSARIDLPC